MKNQSTPSEILENRYGMFMTLDELSEALKLPAGEIESAVRNGTFPIPTYFDQEISPGRILADPYEVGRFIEKHTKRSKTASRKARLSQNQTGQYKDPLISIDALRATRQKRHSRVNGIYFLWSGDEIVYVGRSINVLSRANSHDDKEWDTFSFVEYAGVGESELGLIEQAYISAHKPKLNKWLYDIPPTVETAGQ